MLDNNIFLYKLARATHLVLLYLALISKHVSKTNTIDFSTFPLFRFIAHKLSSNVSFIEYVVYMCIFDQMRILFCVCYVLYLLEFPILCCIDTKIYNYLSLLRMLKTFKFTHINAYIKYDLIKFFWELTTFMIRFCTKNCNDLCSIKLSIFQWYMMHFL